jgi:hypothetical protein
MINTDIEAVIKMIRSASENPDVDKLPSSTVLKVLAASIEMAMEESKGE